MFLHIIVFLFMLLPTVVECSGNYQQLPKIIISDNGRCLATHIGPKKAISLIDCEKDFNNYQMDNEGDFIYLKTKKPGVWIRMDRSIYSEGQKFSTDFEKQCGKIIGDEGRHICRNIKLGSPMYQGRYINEQPDEELVLRGLIDSNCTFKKFDERDRDERDRDER